MSSAEDKIVQTAVGHDALVAGAARDLVSRVMLEIEDVLNHGTPDRKMTILRAFATPLLRTAAAQQESDDLAELRAQVAELQRTILGIGDDDETDAPEPLAGMGEYDAAVDAPPIPSPD